MKAVYKKGSAVVLLILLVLTVLVLFGIYGYKNGWFMKAPTPIAENTLPTKAQQPVDTLSVDIQKLQPSDEVEDIDSDLAKTDLNNIDQDVLGVKTEANGL